MAYSWKDSLSISGTAIPENSNEPLATLAASEGVTDAYSYQLSGSHSGLFTIDLYGRLSLRNELNFESSAVGRIRFPSDRLFSVEVRAYSDDGKRQLEDRIFILTLQDENESDTGWHDGGYRGGTYNPDGRGLNENNSAGSRVAVFRASDGDNQTGIDYSLSGGDVDYFSIDSSGRLYLTSSLDYEDTNHGRFYSVVVTANSGDASPAISQLYVLTVNNANESNLDDTTATWRTRSSGVRRYENEDGGRIANFAARDSDGGAISYWLSGADEPLFSLDSSNRLYVKESFDYESSENIARNHRYTVVVNALGLDGGTTIGDGALALTQTFVFTVRNRNEFETEWESGGNHTGANISENSGVGVSLADFGATDGDGITVTYGLRGRHLQDSHFQIDKDTGVLSTRQEFNFESRSHYSVVVRARSENSNDGSDRLEQTFIVTVGNINEGESTGWERNGRPTSGSIVENNEIGLSVADFGATDGDATSVTYNITGADANYFSINAESGVLFLTSVLDLDAVGSQEYYSVVVHANSADTSNGISSLYVLRAQDAVVEINWAAAGVNGIPGNPSSATINELDAIRGVSLADFNIATDGHIENGNTNIVATEGSGGNVSYWLSGSDRSSFAIDSESGVLSLSRDRNYESDRSSHQYSVVVNVGQSNVDGSISQLFILSVSNENEFDADWRDGRYNSNRSSYNSSGKNLNENNSEGTKLDEFRAADADKVDITYSLAGADAGYFSIDDRGGGVARLYVKSSFDYEDSSHGNLYSVVMVANSVDGGAAISQLYVLTVRNVSEFETNWETGGVHSGNNVSEDVGVGLSLADFGATDGDGITVTYGLRGRYGQDSSFEIDKDTGVLSIKQELNFESRDHYTVEIRARSEYSNDGSPQLKQLFILTVGNIDEFETTWHGGRGYNPLGRNLDENNAAGYQVAQFRASDGDDVSLSYFLTGTDATYFSIDERGRLYVRSQLDYEDGHSQFYNIIVNANSGDASAAVSQAYFLTLNNIDNEPAIWQANGDPAGTSILENNSIGITLADFNAIDPEATDSITYGLRGGYRDDKYFEIDSNSGVLTTNSVFNHESRNRYTVQVRARSTDSDGGSSINQTFVLTVGNENEFATEWRDGRDYNTSGRNLTENNSEGARIAEFRATDGDKVDIDYSLTGTDAGYFSIEDRNGGVGRLYLKSSLDYEDKALYSVVVVADSADDSPAISQLYVLTLNNQNESDINDVTATWHRRSSGTGRNENEDPRQLTQFEARDSDGPGISYWLSGDDNALFSIDTVGRLYTTQTFDAESADGIAKNNRYSVVVNALGTAGDNVGAVGDGLLALTQTYILTIRNRDEFESGWETNGNPTGGNISENGGIGVSLANFGATDGDAAAVTYGLRGRHRDDSYFQIDKETGILTSRKEFDFESKDHYTVVVRAASIDGSDRLEQEFILTIGNVNDNITSWQKNGTPTSSSIFENNEIGLSLADFGATDGDKVAVTYSLSGDDAIYFSIDSESGVLSLMSGLDYEDANRTGSSAEYYSVVVNANSVDASESLSSLYILQLHDALVDIRWGTNGNPSSATITEAITATDSISASGALSGVTVADFSIAGGGYIEVGGTSITAAEGDGGSISYWLSGDDSSAFDINNTGILTLNGPRNYETDRSSHQYSVVVNAGRDGVDGNLSQLFILSVANVDEFGTGWRNGGFREGRSLTENNREGQSIADFNATDGDGVAVTYNISGTDAAYFSIDGENGKLYVVSSLDYEDASHPVTFYSVVVEARSVDANSPADTLTQLYILSVGNRNEFGSDWQTGGVHNGNNVSEDVGVGLSLADFGATDGDGVAVTYSLRGKHRDDSYFEIDKETGVLTSRKEFDFENKEHYTVQVRARAVDGSASLSQDFILTVGNVSDAGVGWQRNGRPTRGSIYENNNIGLSVADFGATDGDGASVTYSLEAGNHTHFFSINEDSGILSLTSSFDYENSHSDYYSVIINASSADSSPDVSSLYILRMRDAVVDINWAADGNPSTATVSESDALIGLSVADFNILSGGHIEVGGANIVAVEGSNGNVSYWLSSGGDSSSFTIDRHSGVLSLRRDRDYETDRDSHQYTVVVNAGQRNKSGSLSEIFILSVADDNDAPAWTSQRQPLDNRNYLPDGTARTIELSEGVIGSSSNGVAGRQVARFKAVDEDEGSYITYGLSGASSNASDPNDSAYFSIDSNGRLYLASGLDFENADHGTIYSVVVHAGSTVDGATNGISNLFVISVTDKNDPTLWEMDGNPSGNAISENNAAGLSVADFGAIDGDANVDVTYSLRGNHRDDKYFEIDSATGVLSVKSTFDFENSSVINHNHRYTVEVRARSDDGSPSINQTFILTIGNADDLNENDLATTWQASPSSAVLAENNAVGVSLANFNASDSDGVNISYWLSDGGDANYFAINNATGVLSAASAFNFEASRDGPYYTVTVNAIGIDGGNMVGDGGLTVAQVFILTVTDVNDAPSFKLQSQPVDGNILANGAWGINLVESVDDSNSGASAGVQVARFGATDEDSGASITYGLTGADTAYFSVDSEGTIYLTSTINFEDSSHGLIYSVVVNAGSTLDGATDGISNLLIMTLTDGNDLIEWQAGGNPSGGNLLESNILGASVANFGAGDVDVGTVVTYSLESGDDTKYFNINANTGVLSVKSIFDYEDENVAAHDYRYSVVVLANAGDGTPSLNQTFVLTIVDANDNDPVWQVQEQPLSGDNYLPNGDTRIVGVFEEVLDGGDKIAQFYAIDADAGDNIVYSLTVDSNYQNYFSIDENGGLFLAIAVNYEPLLNIAGTTNLSVVVNATSTDGSDGISQAFILSVIDGPDRPRWLTNSQIPSGSALAENNTGGDELYDFYSGPPVADGEAPASYSLEGDHSAYFSLGDGIYYGEFLAAKLYAKSSFDYESADAPEDNRYSVIVISHGVSGDGINSGPTLRALYVLTITDVLNEPTIWQAGGNPTGGAIAEGSGVGALVADFNGFDGDGGAVTYSLAPGTDAGFFNINSDTGELLTASSFDFEDQTVIDHDHRYSVVVIANSNDDSPAISQTFILSIDDANEFTTGWQNTGNPAGAMLNENNTAGASLADFNATDGDSLVAVTYSLAGDDANYFNLDNATGIVTAKSVFDYESADDIGRDHRYSIIVIANSADDSDAISQIFVLSINNIADLTSGWSVDGNPSGAGLSENNTAGVMVADFDAIAGTDGVAINYSLKTGNDAVYFSINSDSGELFALSIFDFEDSAVINHNRRYSVIVLADTVDASPAISQIFILTVGNVNEGGAGWQNNGNPDGRTLAENNSINASIADFGATDADGVTVTYSLSGVDADYFNIDSGTGIVTANSAFDFESSHGAFYSINITANSIDGDSVNQSFILTVSNVAEGTGWQANGNPNGLILAENNNVGGSVANFAATDGDGGAIVYTLSGTDAAQFSINADSGVLSATSSFDYENADVISHDRRYSVVITATSPDASPAVSQTFILSVGNVNEFETTWQDNGNPSGISLTENNTIGLSLADFGAIDDDDGASVTYSLSGDTADYFNLDSTSGVLTIKSSIDFEDVGIAQINRRYSAVITATSTDDSPAISQVFVLTVDNMAEATGWQANGNPSYLVINENNNLGNFIVDFNATDGDGAAVVYSLKDGPDNDFFNLNSSNGRLFVTQSFDFEDLAVAAHNRRYSIVVVADSTDDSVALSQMFILSVANVQEWGNGIKPTWQDLPSGGTTFAENTGPNAEVWSFKIDDEDDSSGGASTYELTGDDAGFFYLANTNLTSRAILRAREDFDYEDRDRYSVIVTGGNTANGPAYLGGLEVLSQLFVITIGNVYENSDTPQFTSSGMPTGNTIAENDAPGPVLADFNHVQGGLPSGVSGTYALTGDSTDYFQINSQNGRITLISSLDYESDYGQSIDNRYSMVVVVNRTDDTTPISRLFVVTVTDAPANTITWGAGADGVTISENNSVSFAAAARITDFGHNAGAGVTVTYGLSGDDANYFSVDANTGWMFVTSSFDYEATDHAPYYSVVVHASANVEGEAISRLFVVTVANVGELETIWQNNGDPSGRSLTENNIAGASLADFGATDEEGTGATYGLAGDDTAYFNIDAATGVLTAISAFDYEDGGHGRFYSVVAVAGSVNGDAISQLYVLTVNNQNESVVWETGGNPNGNMISENNSIGISLADFGATDGDGVTTTYSLRGNHRDDDYFAIDATTGVLTAKSEFDFENKDHYTVEVRARSSNSAAINETFVLTISDINDNPVAWQNNGNPAGNILAENNTAGASLADFGATDGDDGATVTYSLATGNSDDIAYFSINADSGVLYALSSFDYENSARTDGYYSVVVVATSTDTDILSELFILSVSNLNDEATTLSGTPSDGAELAENNAINAILGSFLTDDADNPSAGVGHSYWLTGDDADVFTINSTDLIAKLRAGISFDFENPTDDADGNARIGNRYTVIVNGYDSVGGTAVGDGLLHASQLFVLTITDVNTTPDWNSDTSNGRTLDENSAQDERLVKFSNDGALPAGVNLTYGLSGDDADYFNLNSLTGWLRTTSQFDYESEYGISIDNRYSIIVHANTTGGEGTELTRLYILTITDVADGGLAPDPTTPDQPVGLNGKILFDGDTDNLGGINDGIGNEGLIIIGDYLVATQYDNGGQTDLVLNNIENFADSFVGYTDADGNGQNHWFFVRDDAGDNTGHIVFDADGLDVNLESLANGGATTTPDQINLLAGLNFGKDGDFNKPDDLDLNLNGNQAASLTHDQFLALIGGSNNIDFI